MLSSENKLHLSIYNYVLHFSWDKEISIEVSSLLTANSAATLRKIFIFINFSMNIWYMPNIQKKSLELKYNLLYHCVWWRVFVIHKCIALLPTLNISFWQLLTASMRKERVIWDFPKIPLYLSKSELASCAYDINK